MAARSSADILQPFPMNVYTSAGWRGKLERLISVGGRQWFDDDGDAEELCASGERVEYKRT